MARCITATAFSFIGLVGEIAFAQTSSGGAAWLGETYGPHATGTYIDTWIDEEREELTTLDPDDKRRVVVQFWYPAAPGEDAIGAPYIQFDLSLFKDNLGEWGQRVAQLATRSFLDVPIDASASPYPILLYSHGGGAPIFIGTAQAEFLASNGYVVVSVAHVDDSVLIRFPDGQEYNPTPVPQRPPDEESAGWSELEIYGWQKENLQEMHAWHVADLEFALDKLESMNETASSKFWGQLDFTRVGTYGWSRGGATSLQAAADDERVKAAVNLDGSMFGRSIVDRGTSKPILLMENPDFFFDVQNKKEVDPELEELIAAAQAEFWGMFNRSSNDWYRAVLIGSNHYNFTDYPLTDTPSAEAPIAPTKARDIINTIVLEFFDKYLKGHEEAPYLTGEMAFPELKVIRKLQE